MLLLVQLFYSRGGAAPLEGIFALGIDLLIRIVARYDSSNAAHGSPEARPLARGSYVHKPMVTLSVLRRQRLVGMLDPVLWPRDGGASDGAQRLRTAQRTGGESAGERGEGERSGRGAKRRGRRRWRRDKRVRFWRFGYCTRSAGHPPHRSLP